MSINKSFCRHKFEFVEDYGYAAISWEEGETGRAESCRHAWQGILGLLSWRATEVIEQRAWVRSDLKQGWEVRGEGGKVCGEVGGMEQTPS